MHCAHFLYLFTSIAPVFGFLAGPFVEVHSEDFLFVPEVAAPAGIKRRFRISVSKIGPFNMRFIRTCRKAVSSASSIANVVEGPELLVEGVFDTFESYLNEYFFQMIEQLNPRLIRAVSSHVLGVDLHKQYAREWFQENCGLQ